MDGKCKTCRFYQDDGLNRGMGHCHLLPPRIIGDLTGFEAMFPRVDDTDWCGEYEQHLSDAELVLRMRAIGALPPSDDLPF